MADHQGDLLHIAAKATVDIGRDGPTGPRITIDPCYAGGVIETRGGRYLVDLGGLEGVGQAVPLCRDHASEVEDLLGGVTCTTDGRTLNAEGRLNDSSAAQQIVRLFKSGQPLQASVGARIIERESVKEGETRFANGRQHTAPEGGMLFVRRGKLREISIVGVGADDGTHVNIEAKARNGARGEKPMSTTKNEIKAALAKISEHEGVLAASRVDELREAYLSGEIADSDLDAALHEETLRAAKVRNLQAKSGQMIFSRRANPAAGADSSKVMASALLGRYGLNDVAERHFGADNAQRGVDLRASSALDLCGKSLQLEHRDVPTDRSEMIRAGFSTNTLGQAMTQASQAVLIDAYRDTPQTWREIAAIRSTPNFREHSLVRPYQKGGTFDEIGRTGEIKHSSPSAEDILYAVRTWAKMFSISRQDIVDDQVGAIFELQREFGRNAARTLSNNFWNMVKTAGSEFFIPSTNAFSGADTALDIDSFETAIGHARSMTDGDGEPIDIQLGHLVVPPALEGTARQLLSSMELARDAATTDGLPTANPWRESMGLIVEPRLGSAATGGSNAAWYITATPQSVPSLIVSFLNGVQVPQIESDDTAFNTLGRQFRAYIDAGFNTGDHRGIIKMKGTA